MEESRRGIEVAERYLEGRATVEEFRLASWESEGAALYLDPDEYQPDLGSAEAIDDHRRWLAERRARIAPFVAGVEAIPLDELRPLVRLELEDGILDARQWLADAAYFVDWALDYDLIGARSHSIQTYEAFLDPVLLREIVGDPSERSTCAGGL